MSATTQKSPTPAVAPVRRAWIAPKVECLESRPEVTAYTGAGGPLLARER